MVGHIHSIHWHNYQPAKVEYIGTKYCRTAELPAAKVAAFLIGSLKGSGIASGLSAKTKSWVRQRDIEKESSYMDDKPDPKLLEKVDESKRSTLKKLILGSAFAVPVIASFTMSGLGVNQAHAGVTNGTKPPKGDHGHHDHDDHGHDPHDDPHSFNKYKGRKP
jgi:hypothetical protein